MTLRHVAAVSGCTMLSEEQIMAEFTTAEAILRGHFILSSGLHSDTYLQCARVLMNPQRAEKLCGTLAEKLQNTLQNSNGGNAAVHGEPLAAYAGEENVDPLQIDLVVAPAMGGVIVGYEMGRQLGVETIFCEREAGEFSLRRGFHIEPGARVLLVEDVVTTGKSSLETIECIVRHGGKVVAEAALIDRSNGTHNLPFPLVALLTLDVKTYHADHLPAHLESTQAVKPGSRFLKK